MLHIGETTQYNAIVLHDQYRRNEKAETHQHLVIDDLVIVFRFGFQNDFVNGFLNDKPGQIHQQNTDKEQDYQRKALRNHGRIISVGTDVAEKGG